MKLFTKTTALAITCVALAAPIAQASHTAPLAAAQTARLGAQTEATSFKGIQRYLEQRQAEQTAQAAAKTEAAGFKGIQRYLERRYAEQVAQAGAATEAAGFKNIYRYLQPHNARKHLTSVALASVSPSLCPCNIGLPGGPSSAGDVDRAPAAIMKPDFRNRFTTGN